MAVDAARAKSLFLIASELPASERAAYLDRECGADADLRDRVQALLAADAPNRSGEFEVKSDQRRPDRSGNHHSSDSAVGTVIAAKYTLMELIGEGGMGTVWRAKQTEPVKRFVAVKLIKAGMDSRHVMIRIEAERQALALMDHPNIAKVFDGGLHDHRPFFVMELVKGVPITDYCDANKLTPQSRLELFVQTCQAIQHAHQKGIIHRDIKPSNVLVALYDDKPVIKVIDFGVAKATGGRLSEATIDTGFGGVVGTPQYMSPEQATFNNLDIDTRSDVYALGVLLYELLTGSPPFAKQELEKKGLLEMLRVVREDEPPRPSNRLSTADALPSLSANRGTEPKKLAGLLRNELDWIVMKALEKDRTRRYETATGFATDVQRYLTGEAVTAHPPSTVYRIKKFVRRNRGQVIAAGVVLLALIAGMIGTTWGLFQARHEADQKEMARDQEAQQRALAEANEKRANEEKRKAEAAAAAERLARQDEQRERKFAEAIASFVKDDFLGLTSVEGQERFGGDHGAAGLDRNATLMMLLDRAASKLSQRKDLDPRIEAELCWIVGVNYEGAGEAAKGIPFLERSVERRRRVLGADHQDTLNAMNSLGVCFVAAGKIDLALSTYEQTLKLAKAKFGASHLTLAVMNNLASGYLAAGQHDRAVPLFEETLTLRKAKLGPDHPATLTNMNNLALAYQVAGQLDKAVPLHEQTLSLMKTKLGPDHPNTLSTGNNLALGYGAAGQLDKALPLFEETLKLRKAKFGPDHPETLTIMNNLAGGYKDARKFDLALTLYQDTLKLTKAKLGPGHPSTLLSMNNLAVAFQAAGQLDRALPLFEETLPLRRTKLGPDHPHTIATLFNLSECLRASGQLAKAMPLMEEAVKLYQAKLGPDHPETLQCLHGLGMVYFNAKQGEKAAATMTMFIAGMRKRHPEVSSEFAGILAQISLDLLKCEQYVTAEKMLRESLSIREKTQPDDWRTFNTQSMLGGSLLGQKQYPDAEPLLLQGYEGMKAREKNPGADAARLALRSRILEALDRLIELYTATNQPEKATHYRELRSAYPTAK